MTHESKAGRADQKTRQARQDEKALLKTKDFQSGIPTVKQVIMKDLGAEGVGSSASAP